MMGSKYILLIDDPDSLGLYEKRNGTLDFGDEGVLQEECASGGVEARGSELSAGGARPGPIRCQGPVAKIREAVGCPSPPSWGRRSDREAVR